MTCPIFTTLWTHSLPGIMLVVSINPSVIQHEILCCHYLRISMCDCPMFWCTLDHCLRAQQKSCWGSGSLLACPAKNTIEAAAINLNSHTWCSCCLSTRTCNNDSHQCWTNSNIFRKIGIGPQTFSLKLKYHIIVC